MTVFTRIDHVEIGARDLPRAIDAYRRIGFDVDAEGLAPNEDDFLRLVRAAGDGIRAIALRGEGSPAEGLPVFAAKPGPLPPARRHPNRIQRIERVYIAVQDLAAAAQRYAAALALPAPKMERGTVIMADMAVFGLGPTGITLAQPYGPGVAADVLAQRGPGPFQVLFRTASMDAAARWMSEQGIPPPARGIRNTGEQAMLVPPQHASGVYIGFVGPA